MIEAKVAVSTHDNDMLAGREGNTSGTSAVNAPPMTIPRMPPIPVRVIASRVNWSSDYPHRNWRHSWEGNRFESELEQHIALARSDGLAHPDLAGALGHRHQHDVHHPHTAHDQRHARYRKHEDKNPPGELVPGIAQRVLAEDGEVIG